MLIQKIYDDVRIPELETNLNLAEQCQLSQIAARFHFTENVIPGRLQQEVVYVIAVDQNSARQIKWKCDRSIFLRQIIQSFARI